jgi:superfamily II DNA helicase RecQ
LANNISGTTGGDDDPALKFNTLIKKNNDKKRLDTKSFKKLKKLQKMIMKYENTPFKVIFNSKKYKNVVLNQKVELSSHESINQAFTSFFGYSNIEEKDESLNKNESSEENLNNLQEEKPSKELQKDSSFNLLIDLEINPK